MNGKPGRLKFLAVIILSAAFCINLKAQSLFKTNDLFISNFPVPDSKGDYSLLQSNFKDFGIGFTINFTNDFFYNISGGINTGSAYSGLLKPNLNIDLSKMFGWNGANMVISSIGVIGSNFNYKVGTEQGVDNITAYDTWKIYEFWIEQKLCDKKLSLKFGLYDLNSEFDLRLSSLVFLNPSQAIGPEFSLTGENGPSIYPTTSLAFRIKFHDDKGYYIQSSILDGVPGDPNDPEGTHIILNKNDGFLIAGESGFIKKEENSGKNNEKFSLGGWYYTSKFKEFNTGAADNPLYRKGNYGIYFSAEKLLWNESGNPEEGLTAFLRIGYQIKV